MDVGYHMNEKVMLLTLGLAHSLNHTPFLILAAVLPVLKGGVAHESMVSVAVLPGYLAYAVGALLSGRLAGKLGEPRVVTLSIGLSGVCSIIIYALPGLLGLALGFFLVGLWGSFYHPNAYSLISKVFSAKQGWALGVHGSTGSVVPIVVPAAAAAIAAAFGWHVAFLFFGLIAILVSLGLSRIPRSEEVLKSGGVSVRETFVSRRFWKFFAFNIFNGAYYRAMEFITPLFLVQTMGFLIQDAGLAYSTVLAFGAVSQLILGRLTDRTGGKNMLIVTAVMVPLALTLLLTVPHPLLAVGIFVALYGTFYFASQPAYNILVSHVTDERMRAVIFGVVFFMSFGASSLSVPLAGYLSQNLGSSWVIYASLLFAGASLIVALTLPSDREPFKIPFKHLRRR